MTSTPRALAKTDQANAAADTFINQVLTDMVSQIQTGVRHANITARIGTGIIQLELDELQKLVLAARALARLARLHHAVEQLADQWETTGRQLVAAADPENSSVLAVDQLAEGRTRWDLAAQVRKLVDDHG